MRQTSILYITSHFRNGSISIVPIILPFLTIPPYRCRAECIGLFRTRGNFVRSSYFLSKNFLSGFGMVVATYQYLYRDELLYKT